MAIETPSLWEARPAPGSSIAVEYDVGSAVAVLAVRGRWDVPLRQRASAALAKCYAEHPDALILDLSELDDPAAESAPAWMRAQSRAAMLEPPIRLALCVSPDLVLADRLQGLGVRRFLPVYARVRQARVALEGGRLLTDRVGLALRSTPDAPGRAGELVAEACRSWEMPRLQQPSRMVVAELVHNAVEHAGTDLALRVTRRLSGVRLAVSDGNPALPRMTDPPGRGLRLVHKIAILWGAMPTADGKVVWATVQDRATAP
jgi:hypothetical protein